MYSPPRTTALFLLVLLLPLSLTATTATSLTAYDIVESYGFPVGILPKGVTGYELNPQTGEFKLFLQETCKFSIDGYELEYKSTITGIIQPNRISHLTGIKVRVLFFWLSINEVVKKGGDLEFSVGIASAYFPLEGFDESPTCGCGFDCDDHKLQHQNMLLSFS